MTNVLAMVLAGGRVDELDVLTFFRPKSVLPFGGVYRIIDFPMTGLMSSGIEKVGILSQYRPFRLINHIANGEPWDMVGRNRFATILPPFQGRGASDWYKGTADAIYQNIDFITMHKPDMVMILSGDHIYQMDYRKLVEFHIEKKADLTVAFTQVPKEGASRFGLGAIDEEDERGGRVTDYVEKPRNPLYDWASLTVYLFRTPLLLDALRENARKSSWEFGKDIVPIFLRDHKVYGFKHRGYWGYTRTKEEYYQTSMDLLGPSPRLDMEHWNIRTNLAHRNIRDRKPGFIGPNGSIGDSLVYSGCKVFGRVSRSILFPGVVVGKDAVVEDSILFFDSAIGEKSQIRRVIADVDSSVGPGSVVGGGTEALTIVGRGAEIPDTVRIDGGVTVYPNLKRGSFFKYHYEEGEVIQ